MLIRVSKEKEQELRHELEFIKSYRESIDHVRKYLGVVQAHSDMNLNNLSEEFRSDLDKLKMALVREVGSRRKRYRLLGMKSEFPGDM